MTSDEEILNWYFSGFNDELLGSSSTIPNELLLQKAYSLGALHALVGDDVRSVDYLEEEEILKMIKNDK